MKEKIERLSRGIFEYEMPELIVSETELVISVEAGMIKEGSLRIGNDQNQRMKGILYVSGKILVLEKTDFIGPEVEIPYYVDAATLLPGEEHVGTICIVSDCGELKLPFTIRVLEPSFQSSVGVVRDLFQFANLARVNWKEAEELFASADFSKIVLQKEKRYITAYEQLIESTDTSQALEEFLVLVHKKKRCDFSILETALEYEVGTENFMENILLKKEQWGYVKVSVACDAPYISLSATELTVEDFVNGQAAISFVVQAEKMHRGNYFTEFVISAGRKRIVLPAVFRCHGTGEAQHYKKNLHRLEYRLTEQYIKFRNDQITGGGFLSESGRILESILALLEKQELEASDVAAKDEIENKKNAYELYRAYLSIVDGKNRNAEEGFAVIQSKKSYYERNHRLFYCAVLYLEAMKSRDRMMVEEYAGIIRSYYEQDKKEDLLLWFLLYMDKRLESNKSLRYETIRKHCSSGRISPVLLFEAAILWNAEPMTVTALTGFECQVMRYLIRNKMVGKEAALQFAYLSDRMTDQAQLQIWILRQLYDRFQHKDILNALCRLLVRGGHAEKKYHVYFKQAVKEQIRLDRIYEYYLMTLDRNTSPVIDQQVLLYFSYSSFLSEEDAAFVYAYVVRNKGTNPAIYRAYLKNMEQFAVNQMKAGIVSESLAVLYADVLRTSIIDREMAQMLPEIIFTYRLECSSPHIQSVCVAHKEEKKVQIVPITEVDGVRRALVSIYTENAEVFLQDAEGRRYMPGEEDKLYRLMHAENFLDTCYEIGSDNRKLLLHIWEKNKNYNKYDKLLIDLQKQISQMSDLRVEMQNNCLVSLVEYYYENYNVELLEAYLNAVNLRLLSAKDRERMLELMILRDMYDKVLESVEMFGCSVTMQAKRISKLCVRGISSPREEKDRQTLLFMGYFAFKNGKIEDRLLQYLADRYNGTTGEMYELWKAAKERELETTSMEERLLAQMLFAESYVDDSFAVFVSYCGSGMNRKLLKAYYAYCSYKYFVRDRMTNPELFEMLKKESFLENTPVCMLAMLKHYSGKETLLEAEKSFVNYYVQKCVQKKLIFPFFKEFEGKIALPANMLDKYYVEYRSNPKNRLKIHYSCNLEETDLRVEEMVDVGYGVFVKELILFYGESLQYFISVEDEEGIEVVESRMVHHTEMESSEGTTKYGKINEILMTQDMKDEKTLFSLLEQYYKEEYAINRHFSPV